MKYYLLQLCMTYIDNSYFKYEKKTPQPEQCLEVGL